ncbi:hypothetical protein A2701_01485 [Candidatus Amesbacteria bacterium RIFCSPHIGHO2_01_FULL_47_34]|uniref:UPF0102 protein A2972_02915 n=5 Tax=Candidatus Amesiibacteriota TaxID=1752730 RepID=A0A1F4Z5A1_9BACT|nr:MAG: hypothetical protein A2701_01485 [Candidatus Amesbacteria bacterium RIFCSPHIGHO2_01_FULL_47_34]OGD01485.1 MAG: hypothetical protein A2972_02915 [Candidatus Amesbacteria bacterium RIFCSPLOWO2_01_FULL_47_33]
MKRANRKTGEKAETAVGNYLENKGYELMVRNFRTRYGEIDLICRDGNLTVFVEVKAKKGLQFGSPEEMFTSAKYRQVRRMATAYLEGREVPCRIDMVAVELGEMNEVSALRHYENVVCD